MTLTVYHLRHNAEVGRDSFDGFVVAAASEYDARRLVKCADECGSGSSIRVVPHECTWHDETKTSCFVIGVAAPDVVAGVILESFNAG